MRVIIILLLSIATIAVQSCRKKGNKYAGLPTSILKDTTTVEFLEKEFNFDTIHQGEKVTHLFKIKNTGEKNLIIGNAYGSCGCTVPEYPKDPIAPGTTKDIKVTFNSEHKEGEQHKTVTLQVNTSSHNEILSLSGYVIAPKKDSTNTK